MLGATRHPSMWAGKNVLSTEWYQLLDLASVYGTLLSDAGGIYDPRHYDDRLLLGLLAARIDDQA